MNTEMSYLRQKNLSKFKELIRDQKPRPKIYFLLINFFRFLFFTISGLLSVSLFLFFLIDFVGVFSLEGARNIYSNNILDYFLLADWELLFLAILIVFSLPVFQYLFFSGQKYVMRFTFSSYFNRESLTFTAPILTLMIGGIFFYPMVVNNNNLKNLSLTYNQTAFSSAREKYFFESEASQGRYFGTLDTIETVAESTYKIKVTHNQYSQEFIMKDPQVVPPQSSIIWLTYSENQNGNKELTDMGVIN